MWNKCVFRSTFPSQLQQTITINFCIGSQKTYLKTRNLIKFFTWLCYIKTFNFCVLVLYVMKSWKGRRDRTLYAAKPKALGRHHLIFIDFFVYKHIATKTSKHIIVGRGRQSNILHNLLDCFIYHSNNTPKIISYFYMKACLSSFIWEGLKRNGLSSNVAKLHTLFKALLPFICFHHKAPRIKLCMWCPLFGWVEEMGWAKLVSSAI